MSKEKKKSLAYQFGRDLADLVFFPWLVAMGVGLLLGVYLRDNPILLLLAFAVAALVYAVVIIEVSKRFFFKKWGSYLEKAFAEN